MNRILSRMGRTALMLTAGTAVFAQGTQTASASIEVVEASGAAIAGATVRLVSPSMQGPRAGATDAGGRFVARLLPPGSYQIEVSKDGYQTVKFSQQLGIDQNFTPKFTLVKTGGAVVEVFATTPAVDKTDVKSATNFRSEVVDRLPNGRSMESVAFLTPGVTTGVGNRVQVRGAMTSGNLYLVDGQNVTDNVYGNRGTRLIDDAIEETQVLTGGVSAEYGNFDGGVLNVITKSGSNEFAGQLRYELSNPAWNAKRPTGYKIVAGKLAGNTSELPDNLLNDTPTLSIGGPILKDKLWFFFSYYKREENRSEFIRGNAVASPIGASAGYTYSIKEFRRALKLSWAINQNHTLVVSGTNSSNSEKNRDYSAGDLNALIPQMYEDNFINASLRSILTNDLTMEIKVGSKHQKFTAGGSSNGQSRIFDYFTNIGYNKGPFDSTDGGDNRDNRTLDAKWTLFWEGAGSHQTDAGLNYYQGTHKAKNSQTATGYIFGTAGVRYNTATNAYEGRGYDMWTFKLVDGKAKNANMGFFVNDKWTLGTKATLNMGLRWDKFEAKNETNVKTAGASGFSPRLGMKYDVLGDGKWQISASAARYGAKVLEGVTNAVTGQGNPAETDYAYVGPGGYQPFSVLQNPANYDRNQITYFQDPLVNVRLRSNLKAPHVDEFQASAAYVFGSQALGDGFVRLTAVKRSYKDLFDYRQGNEGTVLDGAGQTQYLQVWENSKDAKREYKGLEFDSAYNKGPWAFGGNITWSSLKGNYEGEGTSSPARGEGINSWNVVNGQPMFDRTITAPDGYLLGHLPLRIRATASHVSENRYGKTTWGWVYRFDSGARYNITRSIDETLLNANMPDQAPGPFTQYKDGRRGQGIYNATTYLDMSVMHEWAAGKVSGRNVNAFVKFRADNVFNHQQQLRWNTNYNAALTGPNDPFVAADIRTGQPTSGSHYGDARTYYISAGLRF